MRNMKKVFLILFIAILVVLYNQDVYASGFDEKKPEIQSLTIVNNEVLAPGYVDIFVGNIIEDDSGITEISLQLFYKEDYNARGTSSYCVRYVKNLSAKPLYTNQSYTIRIPVSSTLKTGEYVITGMQIKDGRGNYTAYYRNKTAVESLGTEHLVQMSGDESILPCYINDSVNIYSTSADLDLAISNPYIVEKISEMADEKVARIFVDSTGKTVISKEILDTIKGTNKKLIIAVSDGIEWYINGQDIIQETKDIDCAIKIEKIEGEDYGQSNKIIQLRFGNNGILPGKMLIRLKADYIFNLYKLEKKLYLYYLDNNIIKLEDSPQYILDGTDHWCEFYVTHNSTFLVSGSELQLKPKVSLNTKKITMQVKQESSALKIDEKIDGDMVSKWTTSDSKIVSVNKKTGKLKAKKVGTATITLKMKSGAIAKCTVKVQKNVVKTKKIIFEKSKITINKGKSITLKTERQPITANDKIAWKSSNSKVVKVNSKGKIMALKKGTAIITVTAKSGKKDTIKIVVK